MKHYWDPTTYKSRADESIAYGALTNSKRPEAFVEGAYPTHARKGYGVRFMDDKREYVDFGCANGTNILGYGHPEIGRAIASAYASGSLFTVGSTMEVEAAEALMGIMPFIKRVRFLKTGSEACQAAILIARAATGRTKVLSDGYHGWSPEFTSLAQPGYGCLPGQIRPLPTDLADVTDWDSLAAVIIEPVQLDYSKERRIWLENLKDKCVRHGVVLIFDEVITGFRFPKFSVSNYWGIYPDLICLGKAMGGGLPLAAVGGRLAVMEPANEYFVSSTFAGDTCALAAFMALLKILNRDVTSIERLWQFGITWKEKFTELTAGTAVELEGYPTRGYFKPSLDRDMLFQEAALGGIVFSPSLFLAFPHEHEGGTFKILENILWSIRTNRCGMKFQRPRPAFAQTVRDKPKDPKVVEIKSKWS